MPISLIICIKLIRRKNRKFRKSFLNTIKKKTVIIVLLHLRFLLKEMIGGEIKAGIKRKFELE
ncbi:hypothetical protein MCM1_1027 [Methanosarcina barkeri CM1]|uniref:Uncharacterized protein n=1 Tax=Methanosarcina barkeri CM1 TaxID=796385 RepID=A0A0G3CG62_METBA|nr:hypothetical protein MCM1_1027 [Methanosarcina barkeri CM1]